MIDLINAPRQFTTPRFWPLSFRLGSPYGFAFVNLPGGFSIAWNLANEPEERTVWQFSRLTLTRLETEEEQQERLLAWEEEAYEARCADFYSY